MPELEEDIRATAPQPREEFVERLERRVEAGFPKPKKPRRERSVWWAGAPVLAGTLALFVGISVLAGSDGSNGDFAGGGGSASESVQQEREPANESGATAQPTPEALESFGRKSRATRGGVAAPGRPRVQERSAQLGLSTPADEFDEHAAGVLQVADSVGAIVQRSNVTERNGEGYATYDLRVPSSRLDETLAQLGDLAKVTTRRESGLDITGLYVSAQDRLRDGRAERRSLLRALERADSPSDRADIRRRLREVRSRIARAEADVRRTRARADRARVDVTLRSTGESGAWTPGDAVDDAGRILQFIAGVLLVVAAVLSPLLVLAGLWVITVRVTRRRRRNAVLG